MTIKNGNSGEEFEGRKFNNISLLFTRIIYGEMPAENKYSFMFYEKNE